MAFEVALVLVLGVVIIAALISLAKPITEAATERIKFKYREMGSENEKFLKDKVNFLEGELIAVKQQLTSVQETLDYVTKEIESKGVTIKTSQKQDK